MLATSHLVYTVIVLHGLNTNRSAEKLRTKVCFPFSKTSSCSGFVGTVVLKKEYFKLNLWICGVNNVLLYQLWRL